MPIIFVEPALVPAAIAAPPALAPPPERAPAPGPEAIPAAGGLSAQERARRLIHIGASEVAAVLGVSEFESPRSLWHRKIHRLDFPETDDMRRGRIFEPAILEMAAAEMGVQLDRSDLWHEHANSIMACTLDAKIAGQDVAIEAKRVSYHTFLKRRDQWGPSGSDIVPDHYLLQCTAQMAVMSSATGRPWDLVFLAALIGDDLRIYPIRRHQQLIDIIEARVPTFWQNHVVPQVPPDGETDERLLSQLPRVARKRTTIDPGLRTAFTQTEASLATATAAHEASRSHIIEAMGDAEIADCGDSGGVFTYTPTTRTNFDTKRLKHERPDVYRAFVKPPTTFRTLHQS